MVEQDPGAWDDVVRAVRKGDRDRFRDIVLHFQDELRFVVAYHVRGDAEQIDELVHGAFVTAFRDLGRFELGKPLGPWLKGIARHEALDEVRRLRRSAKVSRELVRAELARVREDAEAPVDSVARLRGCVERLKEGARDLVRLRYFENRTFEAAAAALGRSAGALRVAMLEIRRSLKTCLERPQA